MALSDLPINSHNPNIAKMTVMTQHWFRLLPVRSPLLRESLLFSFPPGTEMFQFPGLAPTYLCIQHVVAGIHRRGFPHSDIYGSKPV